MQITADQMIAFGAGAREQFAARLAIWIRSDFPDAIASRELDASMVDELAQQIIELARRHDIHLQHDVETFAGCILSLESSLVGDPRYPWADDVLSRSELSGTRKVLLLHDYTVFHLAREMGSSTRGAR